MKEWAVRFTIRYADGRREDAEERVGAYNIGLALRSVFAGRKAQLEGREDVSWVEVRGVVMVEKMDTGGTPDHCADDNI